MLTIPNVDDARRLRDFFDEAGYTESGLIQQLGTTNPPLPQLRNLPRLLEKTREPTLLNILVRWFLGNFSVEPDYLKASQLPDWFINSCLQQGLLKTGDDERLIPTIQLVTHGELLVASDTYQHLYSADAYDHVLTVNPAAYHLLNFTLREPVKTTLDLASGNGIQALLATAHSEQVVATDLNPRAAAYAEFNARLNDITNIECLVGDLLQPVENRTFDLIVCNPPFIMTPAKQDYLYRDNDQPLDGFCRQLAQQIPPYLNEGGFYQMICEWVEIDGQPWEERLSEWFKDSGCDIWVLRQYVEEPAQYAVTRLRETSQDSIESDIALYDEWLKYYHTHQVTAIHGGLIAMRRRSGDNWVSFEEIAGNVQQPFGDLMLQRFDNRDFLITHADDDALLQSRLRLHPDARVQQDSARVDGNWQTQSLTLSLKRDLTQTVGIDEQIAQFITQCDGQRTLAELVEAVAAQVDADTTQVRMECLRAMRFLLARGLLLV